LTAVRGGGALVVQTASNMVEWIKVTGGGDRYPSSMRGQWGDETTAGTADNFELGLVQIPVHIYSYPVDFSRALLEDAANLEQIFTNLVADTLAIDEDEAFLIGDGANKPRGILPASANGDSLTEKALSLNGTGSDVTVEGVKGLRRGVASQYRSKTRASWIANSSTGETIELFQDGEGRFYYQYLEHGEYFLQTPWRESEAMPDIGANTYPMVFGDLSGYAIVERLGMAIERFHDSNTGVKKYRFAIYRRLGGRLIEPWKISVGKVATSV
jgi:HK97 family phage major capsid protein